MCTNDAPVSRPADNPELPRVPPAETERIVERIPYDLSFTDELIRRCRARAVQGYRLAATTVAMNNKEVLLVFEAFEWNGVTFPTRRGPDMGG